MQVQRILGAKRRTPAEATITAIARTFSRLARKTRDQKGMSETPPGSASTRRHTHSRALTHSAGVHAGRQQWGLATEPRGDPHPSCHQNPRNPGSRTALLQAKALVALSWFMLFHRETESRGLFTRDERGTYRGQSQRPAEKFRRFSADPEGKSGPYRVRHPPVLRSAARGSTLGSVLAGTPSSVPVASECSSDGTFR